MNIDELFSVIDKRVKNKTKNSYTNKLLKSGPKKIAQKFGEEANELVVDFLKGSKKRTVEKLLMSSIIF